VPASTTVSIKPNLYLSQFSTLGSRKVSAIIPTAAVSKVQVSASKSVQIALSKITKGAVVSTSVKLPDSSILNLGTSTAKKAGQFTLPPLKLKPGTYTFVVKIGATKKVITVVVKK